MLAAARIRPMSCCVSPVEATTLMQALWNAVVWILVVSSEFAAVAVIVAPRAVARELKALLTALAPRTLQGLAGVGPKRGPGRPSQEGT
jgi:hypothetical protein